MFSAFDRTCVHFGVVACSAARRERWRTSEIAGKRAEERRVREGKWDTHATASTGCPRTDPTFNINDGHVDENGVGVSRGGCFVGGAITRNSRHKSSLIRVLKCSDARKATVA